MNSSCRTRPWGAATAITKSGSSRPGLCAWAPSTAMPGSTRFTPGGTPRTNASKTASTSPSAIWTPTSPCRAPWSSRGPGAPSPRNASSPLPHPLGAGAAGVGMDRRSGPESHSPAPSHRVWAVRGAVSCQPLAVRRVRERARDGMELVHGNVRKMENNYAFLKSR